MNKTTESTSEIEPTTGSYVQLYVYRVPKKNHDAMVQVDKQIMPWFNKYGGRMEFFQLSNSETIEGLESIAKTLSIDEDEEEVWVELNYFRDRKHFDDTFTKMLQDESAAPLFKQFENLINQGKSKMITGGFSRLKV